VIDHLGINCADWDKSKAFYDKVLGVLGYTRQMDFEVAIGYGKTGIIGEYDFARRIAAVLLGLFSCIRFERQAILHNRRYRCKVGDASDFER